MTTLNTIVADQLITFKNEVDAFIEKKGVDKKEAIVKTLQQYLQESKRVIFNGDGYAKEWEKEAAKRGLSNVKARLMH